MESASRMCMARAVYCEVKLEQRISHASREVVASITIPITDSEREHTIADRIA